ncbi:MAG TPA: NAD-dependent epimerase/dehydratase family protein [Longimicrobiales bacterium]|nr:NAD-dependent epimerase/dehydratase family protein [Longimicrobiales bacterium]
MAGSRREFLERFMGGAAAFALELHGVRHLGPGVGHFGAGGFAPRALRILILGGTSFLGPHQIRYALERGHTVTIFNRGRSRPRMFTELVDGVEHLQGDRGGDLAALRGRTWDAVIDNSGQDVGWVRASAEALRDAVQSYLFVSSTGVFYPYLTVGLTEDVEPRLTDDPPRDPPSYGVMKARSEQEVRRVFGDRALVVRPNYIVGPGDTTDRFPYWPVRIARGGEVLVPGGHDDPVQFVDVRDLTEWMIRLLEEGVTGVFNAAGPFPTQATIAEMVYGIRGVTTADVTWAWIDDYDFLSDVRLGAMVPWVMPRGNSLGHTRINYDRAVAHGLTHRPLAVTVRDTLDWWASDAVPPERRTAPRFVLTPEREAEIIRAWRRRGA